MLLLREDGTVWGWGSNSNGEIDPTSDEKFFEDLHKIQGIDSVMDIDASPYGSMFLDREGQIYILSKDNEYPSKCNEFNICQISLFENESIIKMQGSISAIFALNKQGELLTTGFYPKDLGRFEDDSESDISLYCF